MNKKRRINTLSAQIDLPAMELGILDFWTQNQIFEKSVENRNGAPRWSFYEGPPTANGNLEHIILKLEYLRICSQDFKP
jgi:Isoleucyl-tRNA synthetase